MRLFKHGHILRIFSDLKTRTLISWSEKGLISPAVNTSGTGTHRQYSQRNLVEIGIIRELVVNRMPHEVIRFVMKSLVDNPLFEQNNFDAVVVIRRGVDSGRFNVDVQIESRSNFANQALELIFGETQDQNGLVISRMPRVGSVVLISLADIWNYISQRI